MVKTRMVSTITLAASLAAMLMAAANAADLIIAENGKCDYQIVVPDQAESKIVDQWLWTSAKLMEVAFEKNGFEIDVVKEGEKAEDKPGIYLGATEFAKKNGVTVDQFDDWTYRTKVIGDDLVIIGNDKKDPSRTIRRSKTPLALLGTVKGVCDFLREHLGVRFLYNVLGWHNVEGEFNEDGTLKVDTRSFAFMPVKKITLPKDLDRTKTPMMKANYDFSMETFYNIANNFFPMTSFVQDSNIRWYDAVEPRKYCKTNPEFFALDGKGGRSCDKRLPMVFSDFFFCSTNKGAQDLMAKAIKERIDNGKRRIGLGTQDSFGLIRCNCEDCNKFFGMKAENMEQIRARAKSGKLWQVFFSITNRFLKSHPDVKFILSNYQDTPISADIIKRFPDNVIPRIQFASQEQFDRLKGVEFPSGVCGFEETFTGFGRAGRYVPERTAEHMAEFVKTCERNNVRWSGRDGVMGNNPGMEGLAYYVYGRMMDDPSADWKDIRNEFCDAAFGRVSSQMRNFYILLDKHIALYSDFLGVMMPAWGTFKYSFSDAYDSQWHVMAMFTPKYIAAADRLLNDAEKNAKDPDVKARLHLIRIEFDYISKLAKILHMKHAYAMNPANTYKDSLLDAIDEWHEYLANLATLTKSGERGQFKPLDDWPEMRPFHGHNYNHAAQTKNLYRQTWMYSCINWDTQAIRDGALDPERSIKVPAVQAAPGIDSKAWDSAPEQTLIKSGGKPFNNIKTTIKLLRDQDALYVLVKGKYPRAHPEDISKKKPDGDVFRHEYVEIGISPSNADGKVYRIVVNPAEECRFDSIVTPASGNRTNEDKTWNGTWEYACETSSKKGRWTLPGRVWTVWFRIPFSDFGLKAPEEGASWGFNVGRNRKNPYIIWQDGKSAATPNNLGKLFF